VFSQQQTDELLKEKLIIQNFGPIKSVELELGRFNVLIGENATGKSTVAKVLAVCRYFSYIVPTNSIDDEKKAYFENGAIEWGLTESFKADTFIRYQCEDYIIEVEKRDVLEVLNDNVFGGKSNLKKERFYPEFKFKSEKFQRLIEGLERSKIFQEGTDWVTSTSFFLNEVKRTLDNPLYVPTERGLQSLFSLGKSNIQNFSDKLYEQLFKLDSISKIFTNGLEVEVNGIRYKNENGQGYFSKDGGLSYYSMYNAPSGIKSIIPFYTLIERYIQNYRKKTFIIEEPELNLFPIAQNELMQYFVHKTMNLSKAMDYGNSMLLTTHSPYILTSLNNMMYAYELGQRNESAVENVMQKKYWLNPNEVSAYIMTSDGHCKNIIDKETGLIMAEVIDTASDDINSIYDHLSEINFG
jgi:predicted ATPase